MDPHAVARRLSEALDLDALGYRVSVRPLDNDSGVMVEITHELWGNRQSGFGIDSMDRLDELVHRLSNWEDLDLTASASAISSASRPIVIALRHGAYMGSQRGRKLHEEASTLGAVTAAVLAARVLRGGGQLSDAELDWVERAIDLDIAGGP